MVSTEWGAPKVFKKGFQMDHAFDPKIYGRSLNFFSWKNREHIQTVDLGEDGIAPLEVRFLHDPKKPIGFVGCGVNATVFRYNTIITRYMKIESIRFVNFPFIKNTSERWKMGRYENNQHTAEESFWMD